MQQRNRQDEKTLVQKIIQQDQQALQEFVRMYERPLYAFITKKIQDKEVAEEIMQDVFIDFLEALRDFQFQSSVKTFLFSIAKYKCIDVIRKKKVKKVLFSHMPDYIVDQLAPVFIDDELEHKELVQKMEKVLASLPSQYQLILRLKYVDGVRVKAIAQQLSMNFKSTESLLFRARRAFMDLFQTTQ